MHETSPELLTFNDTVALAEYNISRKPIYEGFSPPATCVTNDPAANIDARGQEKLPSIRVKINPRGSTYLPSDFLPMSTTGDAPFAPPAQQFVETNTFCREDPLYPMPPLDRSNLEVFLLTLITLAGLGLGSGLISNPAESTFGQAVTEEAAAQKSNPSVEMVVDRIVVNESQGDPTAKNTRSTAMGAGQFVDGTWLDLIRAHRRDLFAGRSEKDVLDLRSDPELSREMTRRFIERNAAALAKRGLPVTPGSLYLAHFAGPAGAVAILTSPRDADAAMVIADADTRPEVTRTKIINSNPFLRGFTVDDLKNWADAKMEGLAAR